MTVIFFLVNQYVFGGIIAQLMTPYLVPEQG